MKNAPKPPPPNNQRKTFRQAVDIPVELTVRDYPVSVHAQLMDLSAEGCRVRSLISLEKDKAVSFEFKVAGKPLILRGRIAARKKLVGQAFYEYGIAFDKLQTAQADAVVKEVMELQRRAAISRSEARDGATIAPPPGKGQKRTAYRAMTQFPIKYRREGRVGLTDAEANDLSVGGLRLITNEVFPKDASVILEFTLPQEVLSVFSDSGEPDPSPFGNRGYAEKKSDRRRPFEPMTIKAKIAARLKDSSGRIVLGVQFLDVDAFTREEIQRYIHAVQIYKMRQSIEGGYSSTYKDR